MKILKSYTELYELHEHLPKFDVYHKGEKYRLQLPQLETDENNRLTSILNNYSGKCGGNTKNVAMGMALTAYIIAHFFEGGTFSSFGVDGVISVTVYTLFGAIMGKLSGLIYIRWKMIKFIGKLLSTDHSSIYQHSFSKL